MVAASLEGDDLRVFNTFKFNWIPVGKEFKITKAVKNRVYEIDGVSALNIYKKYLGDDIASKLPKVGIEIPLMKKKRKSLSGKSMLRVKR